jgi:hypothetical protein
MCLSLYADLFGYIHEIQEINLFNEHNGKGIRAMYAAAHIQECDTSSQAFSDSHQENPVYASAVSAGEWHMLVTARDGRLLTAAKMTGASWETAGRSVMITAKMKIGMRYIWLR